MHRPRGRQSFLFFCFLLFTHRVNSYGVRDDTFGPSSCRCDHRRGRDRRDSRTDSSRCEFISRRQRKRHGNAAEAEGRAGKLVESFGFCESLILRDEGESVFTRRRVVSANNIPINTNLFARTNSISGETLPDEERIKLCDVITFIRKLVSDLNYCDHIHGKTSLVG